MYYWKERERIVHLWQPGPTVTRRCRQALSDNTEKLLGWLQHRRLQDCSRRWLARAEGALAGSCNLWWKQQNPFFPLSMGRPDWYQNATTPKNFHQIYCLDIQLSRGSWAARESYSRRFKNPNRRSLQIFQNSESRRRHANRARPLPCF